MGPGVGVNVAHLEADLGRGNTKFRLSLRDFLRCYRFISFDVQRVRNDDRWYRHWFRFLVLPVAHKMAHLFKEFFHGRFGFRGSHLFRANFLFLPTLERCPHSQHRRSHHQIPSSLLPIMEAVAAVVHRYSPRPRSHLTPPETLRS